MKTLLKFMPFLILSVGCTSQPTTTKFDGEWEFYHTDGKTMACLTEDGTLKLRELLIRCEAGQK